MKHIIKVILSIIISLAYIMGFILIFALTYWADNIVIFATVNYIVIGIGFLLIKFIIRLLKV